MYHAWVDKILDSLNARDHLLVVYRKDNIKLDRKEMVWISLLSVGFICGLL
jgi:hypothetical protein